MVVIDNVFNGDDYSDGEDGYYTLIDSFYGSVLSGPVPSPWRVTPDGSWDVNNYLLRAVSPGRATLRVEAPYAWQWSGGTIYATPSLGPTEPFLIVYDVTDAGGVGPHCYLTPSTLEFPSVSLPHGFTMSLAPHTSYYLGNPNSPITTNATVYCSYFDDHTFTVNVYESTYIDWSTLKTDYSKIHNITVSLTSLHSQYPDEPATLPSPLHTGYIAQEGGFLVLPTGVIAEGIGFQKMIPRFDL